MDVVRVERAVLEGVAGVADLDEVALRELVGVDDDVSTSRQVLEVGLQRRGVHRDQDARRIARGHDVVVGEVQLEGRHPGQRPGWCADLGGEVRKRREVVAEGRCLGGEPVAGELHAVAGVAGESDDHAVQLHDFFGSVSRGYLGVWHVSSLCPVGPGSVAGTTGDCVDNPASAAGPYAAVMVDVGTAGRRLVVSVDGRSFELTLAEAGLACCAVEVAAALSGPQVGDAPTGEPIRVLVVSGTVTDVLAPAVLALWSATPKPVRVLSFGACSNSGGPYWDSYSVTKGVDQLLPVDVYVPGCPPRPDALLEGLRELARSEAVPA